MATQEMIKAAEELIADHVRNEENITRVWLFPHDREIRLLEEDDTMIPADKEAVAMYVGANPEQGYPYPSGIGLIRPEEVGRILPPRGWGRWEDAIQIWPPVRQTA